MQEFDPRRFTSPRLASPILAAVVGLALLGAGWTLADGRALEPVKPPLDPKALAALQMQAFAQAEAQPGFARPESIEVKVRRGETLEAAVQRAGVAPQEARDVVNVLGSAFDTVNIKAGLAFDAAIARPADRRGSAKLIGLSMRTSPVTAITVSRTFDGALRLRQLEEKVTEETTVAVGEMQGSLYESAARAGATPTVTAEVVKLFAHQLDFSRDLQPGDDFSLIFDRKVTESGRTIEVGDLLYAEIEAKGQKTRFYRFDRGDGKAQYFDENGKNIKGFLLRTPVDGARMTSRFGLRRHPILGYQKMHQGIDFGAGSGTPILAAGDGVVVEARRWGGYGNWVRIRHSGGWETGYAHMSRYGKGIRAGQRVAQGQVIGYVGTTGRSTGPHLHYEVWLKGRRINPVGAKVPQGTILAGRELAAFKAQKARVDAMLEAEAGTQYAARTQAPRG